MGLADKLARAINAFNEDENPITEDKNVTKGDDFERAVVDLFDQQYFKIVEWTSDISRKHHRPVESDRNPDLVMRYKHKSKNEMFCIECKYRSNTHKGKLDWSNVPQLGRYRGYAKENGIPFFVVIGLGGNPKYPERMFCIPLKEAKYPALYPSIYEKYERDPDKMFFWKKGVLK
ncbi:MAG: hypothetical protein ACT6FF_00005 [Methanosarcinaceae archaeon]